MDNKKIATELVKLAKAVVGKTSTMKNLSESLSAASRHANDAFGAANKNHDATHDALEKCAEEMKKANGLLETLKREEGWDF